MTIFGTGIPEVPGINNVKEKMGVTMVFEELGQGLITNNAKSMANCTTTHLGLSAKFTLL